jgi:hypothetical protein
MSENHRIDFTGFGFGDQYIEKHFGITYTRVCSVCAGIRG